MKHLFFLACFLISTYSFSQGSLSEDNAKFMVDVYFDGFHAGDTVKMKSVTVNNMRMQSVYTGKDGEQKINNVRSSDFLRYISQRPADQKWEEKLLDYKVQIDGNLAQVWTPYQFYVNGKLSHCGANSFTLVQTDDGWKIYSLMDSRRVKNCE